MKKEFQAVFQLSKTEIFEVRYYHLSTNERADFATSAARFCRNKRDFSTCGQAQESVCKGHKCAYNFYKKWNVKHLHDLTDAEYEEVVNYALMCGIKNIFVQDGESVSESFIPPFNYEGVLKNGT